MIRVGVIGYGYWGPNLVRNFADCSATRIAAVCDLRPERLTAAERRYPGILATSDPAALIKDPGVDAVVVATPVEHHFDLAMLAIREGKHVLVEKPIASSSEQASRMIDEAARRRVVLMVDHTFVYTSAVRMMHDLVATGDLGDAYYYDSVRINLGLFQHDVNVLWDLAVHDLSIMDHLISADPEGVVATGQSHLNGHEDIAFITLYFPNNVIAHVNVNWLSPVKVRTTLIGGEKKMLVWNDLEADEKIKVYDKGVNVTSQQGLYKLLVSYRSGDMWSPQIEQNEALRTELQYFVNCINGNEKPFNDGIAGLRVVKMLEASTESLVKRGALVYV